MFDEGYAYRGTMRTYKFRMPIFRPSFEQKIMNKLGKFNPFNKITDGEIKALESLLHKYAEEILKFEDFYAFNLGRNPDDLYYNIRPKEQQLVLMNEFFCETGKKIARYKTKFSKSYC
jgi:hypothetical protein